MIAETEFPQPLSIDTILKAGMLVKPKLQVKAKLQLEKYCVKSCEWVHETALEVLVEQEKFSSGGFRNAFKAHGCNRNETWVLKTYNDKATTTIEQTLLTSVEDHTRKQVQMHSAARQITKQFEAKVPPEFGQPFQYNRVFYTTYQGKPAMLEEFVAGSFAKYVNNNGLCCSPPEGCSSEYKEVFKKAQTLEHYSFCASNQKLTLLDIQGAKYTLYDPEIATSQLLANTDTHEVYFCSGNLSTQGMKEFAEHHTCNKYCQMLDLEVIDKDLI